MFRRTCTCTSRPALAKIPNYYSSLQIWSLTFGSIQGHARFDLRCRQCRDRPCRQWSYRLHHAPVTTRVRVCMRIHVHVRTHSTSGTRNQITVFQLVLYLVSAAVFIGCAGVDGNATTCAATCRLVTLTSHSRDQTVTTHVNWNQTLTSAWLNIFVYNFIGE